MSIVTFTGASGAGKSSTARRMLEEFGWRLITSVTTRAPRSKDLPGEYEYLSDAEFDALRERKQFEWMVEHHGHRYGTVEATIRRALHAPGVGLMLVDPDAVRMLRETYPNPDRTVSFYLLSPEESVLRKRLERRKTRGEIDDAEIDKRIADCKNWDEEALAERAVPYQFVPGEIQLPDAVRFIARLARRALDQKVNS